MLQQLLHSWCLFHIFDMDTQLWIAELPEHISLCRCSLYFSLGGVCLCTGDNLTSLCSFVKEFKPDWNCKCVGSIFQLCVGSAQHAACLTKYMFCLSFMLTRSWGISQPIRWCLFWTVICLEQAATLKCCGRCCSLNSPLSWILLWTSWLTWLVFRNHIDPLFLSLAVAPMCTLSENRHF